MSYLLKHISIVVPWHDTGWDGRVFAALRLKGVFLKRIAKDLDDDAEESVAGQSINDLPQARWPSSIAERVGFMGAFDYATEANHPYHRGPEASHGHFKPTALLHHPYSSLALGTSLLLTDNPSTTNGKEKEGFTIFHSACRN